MQFGEFLMRLLIAFEQSCTFILSHRTAQITLAMVITAFFAAPFVHHVLRIG
jgi:hypothetical protein